jgi:hypothetical protein
LPAGAGNTDSLQIIYDVLSTDPTYQTPLLPEDAAKESGNLASIKANQTNATQKTQVVDGGGNIIGATQGTASNLKTEAHLYDSSTNGIGSTSNALDINIKSGSIANTAFAATQSTATNLKTQSETYQGGTAVSASNPLAVNQSPTTTGGCSIYRSISLVTSPGICIKASAGQVYGWYIANNASSVRYVKFYNKATAPTVGTDTPVMTLAVPANAAANVAYPHGIAFATGIGIGATTGVADNDTTAPSANDVIVNINWT